MCFMEEWGRAEMAEKENLKSENERLRRALERIKELASRTTCSGVSDIPEAGFLLTLISLVRREANGALIWEEDGKALKGESDGILG